MLSPLTASSLKIKDRLQLEEFLSKPEARKAIRAASFEEVFFVIKNIGLADTLELLPIVTGRQVCGFIDLDCWRKDMFVRKPFMEWIAAFIQTGPEETAKALIGIDETLLHGFWSQTDVVKPLVGHERTRVASELPLSRAFDESRKHPGPHPPHTRHRAIAFAASSPGVVPRLRGML